MSFDLNLTTECNHEIFRELSVIDNDLRTVRMLKPLGAVATIKVYATDNLLPKSMYDVITDEEADYAGTRKIRFKNKWQSPSDYFEVSYFTIANFCPKCVGSSYLDDIQWDIRGRLATLRDERLLMQNVEKFVITQLNSNPFHTYIGTGLTGLIGQKVNNPDFLRSQILSEISTTMGKFQNLQSQHRMTGRAVTSGETLRSVESVIVTQDEQDPTVWRVEVTVIAQSGRSVEFTQYLKIRA